MDSEAMIYAGQSRLQPTECCQPCTVNPISAVKLLYKDCLHDTNKALVFYVRRFSFLPRLLEEFV